MNKVRKNAEIENVMNVRKNEIKKKKSNKKGM